MMFLINIFVLVKSFFVYVIYDELIINVFVIFNVASSPMDQ